jgi:MerR family mercuric resistance operon transcriptional regulator
MESMQIGELAVISGVNAQTIRFYERRGLLPSPTRQPNGYRQYDEAAVSLLRFIRSAQSALLTLDEISSAIALRQRGDAPCEHVSTLLARKLEDVHAQQRELALLETELQRLIRAGGNLDPTDCPTGSVCQIVFQPQL